MLPAKYNREKEISGFIELRSCRSQWVRGKTGDNTGIELKFLGGSISHNTQGKSVGNWLMY